MSGACVFPKVWVRFHLLDVPKEHIASGIRFPLQRRVCSSQVFCQKASLLDFTHNQLKLTNGGVTTIFLIFLFFVSYIDCVNITD